MQNNIEEDLKLFNKLANDFLKVKFSLSECNIFFVNLLNLIGPAIKQVELYFSPILIGIVEL